MISREVSNAVNKARALAQDGDTAAARMMLNTVLEANPGEPALANTAANLAMRDGDILAAERLFAEAVRLDPANSEYAINRAIALQRLGKPADAIEALLPIEKQAGQLPKYCNVRAACERERGNLEIAGKWFDQALKADARNAKALHGRARVSIERGESDALARFDNALAVNPADADLWLGKAQALDVLGEVSEAFAIARQLVAQAPAWTEGLKFLAQLRLGAGDKEFAGHYRDAAALVPRDPNIWQEWIGQLSGLDFAEEAADIAVEARRQFPDQPLFALLEAIHSGSAGDDARAESIFETLQLDSSERKLHEARHRIRLGELDRAETLLQAVLDADAASIPAWALIGIVWRLTRDNRGEWLHGQENLFRQLSLDTDTPVLEMAIPLLHRLHDNSPLPLGQSLRGGTQTRGKLFARTEPELQGVRKGILETLEQYRRELPKKDPSHPLLRHREKAWRLEGSWSVRLAGGGDYHTSHIHPQGVVSSALYVERSGENESDPRAGWLEIGRPPPDLRLELEPLAVLPPKPGHLTLFPSTLYHGTRPFAAGCRMTVAFDVVPTE